MGDCKIPKTGNAPACHPGIAIFTLPLVLGRLADALGIRQAYAVVVVLLVAAFALTRGMRERGWGEQ